MSSKRILHRVLSCIQIYGTAGDTRRKIQTTDIEVTTIKALFFNKKVDIVSKRCYYCLRSYTRGIEMTNNMKLTAEQLNNYDHILVAFSGGKDSIAVSNLVRRTTAKNDIVHFFTVCFG